VAQPGSALRSGRRGPQFKSGHPDFSPRLRPGPCFGPGARRRITSGWNDACAALAPASAASAASRLIAGVDDDWLEWTASPDRIARAYSDLNLGALRVTLRWQPGETEFDGLSGLHLRRVVNGAPDGRGRAPDISDVA
jgi:hypothetical protein